LGPGWILIGGGSAAVFFLPSFQFMAIGLGTAIVGGVFLVIAEYFRDEDWELQENG
jgi:hypothetical protein